MKLIQAKVVLVIESDDGVTDEEISKGIESTIPGLKLVGTTTRTKVIVDDVEDIELSRHEREEHLLQAEADLEKQNKNKRGK